MKKKKISWLCVISNVTSNVHRLFHATVNSQILYVHVCVCMRMRMRMRTTNTVNARRDRPKIDSIDFQNDTANPNSNIIAGIFGGGRRGFFEYEKQIKLTKRILFVITSRDIFLYIFYISMYSIYIQFLLEQMRKLNYF